ncbi:MAG: hypothetical protein Q8J74_09140 [Candidatus Didemnitutus sp.]|nr:hypothetical protein [Candidatus Didemnitutus sp.]
MRPFLFFVLVALPAFAQPAAPSLQNLITNSPFAASGPSYASSAVNTPLEFRGTFVESGERFFSILDTVTRRGEWVGLNEAGQLFTVKRYDAANEAISVEFQGRSLELKLYSARIASLPVPAPPQVANSGQLAGGPATVGAPAGTEAQRLAQVAEEIRRRRALRQQAAQPGQLQNPPAPPSR